MHLYQQSKCRLMLISLVLMLCRHGMAEEHAVGEYQLKAAFLYNFTKFVAWPAEAVNATHSPFTICVSGDEAFGRKLVEAVRGETVHGRPIVVRRLQHGEVCEDCQMLFISRSENESLATLLKSVAGRPVLTVSETDGSAVRGSMVNLLVIQGTIKMEVNLARARSSHLEISSYLLKLAKIVETAN